MFKSKDLVKWRHYVTYDGVIFRYLNNIDGNVCGDDYDIGEGLDPRDNVLCRISDIKREATYREIKNLYKNK